MTAGGGTVSARGADQDVSGNVEFIVEFANHVYGKWAPAGHDLINAVAVTDDSNQSASVLALLFQAKLDCSDGVRGINGIVLALVGLDECGEYFQLVASCGAFGGIPELFDAAQCSFIICFTANWFNVQISPSSHQYGHNPRVFQSIL